MKRISAGVDRAVEEAIEDLQIPQAVKDLIEWEATPVLIATQAGPAFAFMIAVSLPLPDLGDWVLYSAPLEDPHAPQAIVNALVGRLYQQCQDDVDGALRAAGHQAPAPNGHRTPGGLIVP